MVQGKTIFGGEHPDEGSNFSLHLEMSARAAQGLRAHLFPATRERCICCRGQGGINKR
jgi:hypothetical protein